MDIRKIEHALVRLDTALQRAENAAGALPRPGVGQDVHDSLRRRHDHLKETVASSLKQLDEILAGASQ